MQRIKFLSFCLPVLACGTNPDPASHHPNKGEIAPQPSTPNRSRMMSAVCTAAMLALGACGGDTDAMPDETTDAEIVETADAGAAGTTGMEAGGSGGAQGGNAEAPQDTGTAGAAGSGGQPEIGEGGSAGSADGGQGGAPAPEYPEPPAKEDLTWEHVFTNNKYLLVEHLTYRDGTYTRTRTYTIIRNSLGEIEGMYGCVAHLITENSVRPEEKGPFLIIRHATKEDFTTYNIKPAFSLKDAWFGEDFPTSYLNELFTAWMQSGGRGCFFPKSLKESES